MRDMNTPCYDKSVGELNICLTSAQRDQSQGYKPSELNQSNGKSSDFLVR